MTKKKDNNYYVYVHRKKTNGEVFYVGKGKGGRAWLTTTRSLLWNRTKDKYGYIVEIVQNNLQEWYAFELEKELICKYGRKDNKTGTLVNMSDGGEGAAGTVKSNELLKKMSDSITGSRDPTFKTEILECENLFTNEIFTGTRWDFLKKFNKHLKPHANRKHVAGWLIKGTLSIPDREAILCNYKGDYSAIACKTNFSFTNIRTGQVVICKRNEFDKMFNINSRALFSGNVRTVVKDWCLTETVLQESIHKLLNFRAGIKNGRADKKEYSFTNVVTDEIFVGTRLCFKARFNISADMLFKGNINIHKYWIITGNSNYKTNRDFNIYTFLHINEEEFIGTKRDFCSKYKVNITGLFKKYPEKTAKGWSLAK